MQKRDGTIIYSAGDLEVLPQLRGNIGAAIETACAATIRWREAAPRMSHAGMPGADHHRLKQVLPLRTAA